ncbi:hypothetical protein K474DRAFT_1670184 [Panus rudis PR-1116 ss-1]|nr:hypothetical protein K474DRAFT_1670184 [Panus rudis PR-1116 ss-1]
MSAFRPLRIPIVMDTIGAVAGTLSTVYHNPLLIIHGFSVALACTAIFLCCLVWTTYDDSFADNLPASSSWRGRLNAWTNLTSEDKAYEVTPQPNVDNPDSSTATLPQRTEISPAQDHYELPVSDSPSKRVSLSGPLVLWKSPSRASPERRVRSPTATRPRLNVSLLRQRVLKSEIVAQRNTSGSFSRQVSSSADPAGSAQSIAQRSSPSQLYYGTIGLGYPSQEPLMLPYVPQHVTSDSRSPTHRPLPQPPAVASPGAKAKPIYYPGLGVCYSSRPTVKPPLTKPAEDKTRRVVRPLPAVPSSAKSSPIAQTIVKQETRMEPASPSVASKPLLTAAPDITNTRDAIETTERDVKEKGKGKGQEAAAPNQKRTSGSGKHTVKGKENSHNEASIAYLRRVRGRRARARGPRAPHAA